MAAKRVIKARDFVNDMRRGLQDTELMMKYRLSSKGLLGAFRKLIDADAIQESEVRLRNSRDEDTAVIAMKRRLPRHYLMFPVRVCDPERPGEEGHVEDITEKGLKIVGIEAEVGHKRTLLIRVDDLHHIDPFVVEAECRWTKPADTNHECEGGFAITAISDQGCHEIRKLIQGLSIGGRNNSQSIVSRQNDMPRPSSCGG